MAVIPPAVKTTESMARIKMRATSTGMRKRKGRRMAMIVIPPIPGIMPIIKPMRTATNSISRFIG
jgi:hypothetical protein